MTLTLQSVQKMMVEFAATHELLPMTGTAIYEDPYLFKMRSKQVRFPRSKKVRIQNKWRKQTKNWKYWNEPQCYRIQGIGYFAHPEIAQKIREWERHHA